jgi:hypothetical protein
MLKHLRPMLVRCALLCIACAAAEPALAASAFGMHTGPKIIMAPRYVPSARSRFDLSRRLLQRDQLDGHHFRGESGLIGTGDAPVEVPVPVEGSETAPTSQPADALGYGAPRRPSPPVGPQIIILPDPPVAKGGVPGPRSAIRAAPAPLWRAERAPYRPAFEPRHFAHRYHPRPWYGRIEPSYERRFAFGPSPIALAPCEDAPHSPIYNTPCGVRPYQ